jgi:putative hemolysin
MMISKILTVRGAPQIGVRVENVDPELVEDLDHYYRKLQRREREQKAAFSLIFSPIYVRYELSYR